jgi:tetratricopeptide (TPR) repeat protein
MAGRDTLRNYLDATLGRLEKSSNMKLEELQKAMSSVAGSINNMTKGAPTEFRNKVHGALTASGVLPDYKSDMEAFKEVLRCIQEMLTASKDVVSESNNTEEVDVEPPMILSPPEPLERRASTAGHRLRGLSVKYMATTFMDEVHAAGLDRNAKIYEIEPLVIRPKGQDASCPRDERTHAAYVDCVDDDNAGIATHMLSYTWGYTIGDIVEGLILFCQLEKLDPEKTFFWICCLCINQHRVKEAQAAGETVSFEAFKDEFGDRVSSIGHIVALMAPWNDPFYTKRVWCDFEMYTAASMGADKCKISVVMPPAEAADMRKTLTSGPISNPKLWEALQNVKIEHAQASVQEDKDRILQLISSSTGFHSLNSTVVTCLRNWIISTCQEILSNLDEEVEAGSIGQHDRARTCARLGYVLRDMQQSECALAAVTRAVELFKSCGLTDSMDWAVLMSNLGSLRRSNNDLEGALASFQRAEKIFVRLGKIQTVECAMFYNSFGAAQRSNGVLGQSLGSFTKGIDILIDIGAHDTQENAGLLLSLGSALKDADDFNGALKSFNEAIQILETTQNTGIPLMGYIMNSIATVKKIKKDFSGALEAYLKSKEHLEKTGAFESQSGVLAWLNIGNCRKQLKDFDGAIEAHENARALGEKLDLMNSDIGARVREAIERSSKGGKGCGRRQSLDSRVAGTKGSKGSPKGGRTTQASGETKGSKGYHKGDRMYK